MRCGHLWQRSREIQERSPSSVQPRTDDGAINYPLKTINRRVSARPSSHRPPAPAEERDQEENQEDEETDFRDRGGGSGQEAKTKDARDERDDEENKCVVKHGDKPFFAP